MDLDGHPLAGELKGLQALLTSPAFQVRNHLVRRCRKHRFVKLWEMAGAVSVQAAPEAPHLAVLAKPLEQGRRRAACPAMGIDQDKRRGFHYRCFL